MKRYEIRICNLEDVWTVYTVEAKNMLVAEDKAYEMHMNNCGGGVLRIETVELR